jgi:hypothetical protein
MKYFTNDFNIKSIVTMLVVSIGLSSCGQKLQLKISPRVDNVVNYSQSLMGDMNAVKRLTTPQNGTLLVQESNKDAMSTEGDSTQSSSAEQSISDTPNVTDCGVLQEMGTDATDEQILDFHKCKVGNIIDFLKVLDQSKLPEAQASAIDQQISRLTKFLSKLETDVDTQRAILAGSRKLIADIKSGKLPQILEEARRRGAVPPHPTPEEKCNIIAKNLERDNLPTDLKHLMQEQYDRECK